ncbi:hypothetical protein LguiA_032460 [Lonicera macranthoides]
MSTSGVGDDNGSGSDQNCRGKRRTREESRSVIVEKMLRKEKTDKLVVKFDPLTGKSMGKIGTSFNNMIHQIVRDTFSPRIIRWADVPRTDIEVVYDRLDVNPVTGELPSVIDTFQQLHCKGNTWRNEYVVEKHDLSFNKLIGGIPSTSSDAMAHLRASQPVESAGSVESGDEVAQPKDLEIMTQVLGSRSRHHKGYGSMPRLKAVGGSRATSSRGTYQDHEKDKVIATLKEQVASQAEQLASQAQQLAAHTDVLAQLQKFIPGFQYQPQIGPSSAASNNPSND